MGYYDYTLEAAPSAPSSGDVRLYGDTVDKKTKAMDANGVISTLNNDGNKNTKIGRASCRERVCQYV